MSNHTYRVTEIVGTSPDGVDQAVRNGITRASQTLRNLDVVRGDPGTRPDRGRRGRALAGRPQARLPPGGVGLTTPGAVRYALALLRLAQLGRPGRPACPDDGEPGPFGVVAHQLVVVHEDPDLVGTGEPLQDLQLGAPGGRRSALPRMCTGPSGRPWAVSQSSVSRRQRSGRPVR